VLLVAALRSKAGINGHSSTADSYLSSTLDLYLGHPISFVNLMYAVFVDVGFWLIYLVQGSTWLIDPHWQIIPVCIAFFYWTHPTAVSSLRGTLTLALVLVWASRLTHNYLRREGWQFGTREDWRYADMRAQYGRWWWLVSFFTVSLAQHPMLVGMTLPLCATMLDASVPLGLFDLLALLCCVAGIVIAAVADNQLFAYMERKEGKELVLQSGLWRYSRHPNHFGEQLWWIGLAMFGMVASGGQIWPTLGVLYNHPIDTLATLRLIEDRMLSNPKRRDAFKAYQASTSLLVPWPPRAVRQDLTDTSSCTENEETDGNE